MRKLIMFILVAMTLSSCASDAIFTNQAQFKASASYSRCTGLYLTCEFKGN